MFKLVSAAILALLPLGAVAAPVASEWQGAYAGITLGYAFGGDDDIGARPPGIDIGNAELSGANAGLRLGYRWQRDRWVVGPELAYVAGDISDDFEFDSAPLGLADSEIGRAHV